MNTKIVISLASYKTKPSKNIGADEFQLLENYATYTKINVRQFAQLCADGHTFFPAYFKEGAKRRGISNCEGVWVIGLDFDGAAVPPEDFVDYAESVGLAPNFYYYTFSQDKDDIELPEERYIHKSKNYGCVGELKQSFRYRVVWVLEEEISIKTFGEIVTTLIEDTFKDFKGDAACKDPSRLFFGSNTYAVVVNTEPTKLSTLGWAKVMEVSKQGKTTKTIHRQKKAGAQEWEEVEVPEAITVGAKWMDILNPYCNLWAKWMRGEYLNYNQRLTLWSNLKFLKYNSHNYSVKKDIMSYVRPEIYEGHTFSIKEIDSKFRDTKLKPAPIVKYRGMRMTVVDFFSSYTNTAARPQLDLEELNTLDEWMDNKTDEILNNKGFIYFQSQTASGKTERIIRNLVEREFNIEKEIYACPTHVLAIEFEKRLRAAAPDMPIYRVPPTEYTTKDLIRLNLGLSPLSKDRDRAQALLKLFDKNTKGVFIITHSLLINLGGRIPASRIIVDENIEEALIKNIKVSIPKLNSLKGYLPKEAIEKLDNLIEQIKQENIGFKLDNIFGDILKDFDIDEYLNDIQEDDAIEGLFSIPKAEALKVSTSNGRKCLRALVKSELISNAILNDIPIKLLTATPMSQRLKNYYRLDFEVITAPLAKNKGCVNQYRGISGARGISNGKGIEKAKLDKYSSYIQNKLKDKKIEDCYFISFKGSKALWEEKGFNVAAVDGKEIHLMNCAGLDCWKGKNIIVCGKFDKPDEYYYDLWSDIGDGEMPKKQNQRIFYNGIWQTLYLWDKEELRNEQLQYMEYATQQAIGRARALREDAEVHLFSNFVPLGVDKVYD